MLCITTTYFAFWTSDDGWFIYRFILFWVVCARTPRLKLLKFSLNLLSVEETRKGNRYSSLTSLFSVVDPPRKTIPIPLSWFFSGPCNTPNWSVLTTLFPTRGLSPMKELFRFGNKLFVCVFTGAASPRKEVITDL